MSDPPAEPPSAPPATSPRATQFPPLATSASRASRTSPTSPGFSTISPIFSRLSQTRSPPARDDGFDNFPIPLPHDPVQLQRMLTSDPDLERQMGCNDADIGPPPEGGFEAWACISGAFFVLFCIFGFTTSFGQLQSYYLENQLKNYSKSEVAWIASVQTLLTFAGSLFSGRYFDSHGARTLCIAGSVLSVGALVGIAFCTEYWQFMLGHAAYGLSGTLLYSPSTAVAGHWFMRRRSTAVGIVVAGSGLAGVIYPIALKRLIDELNFRNALLIIAAMNTALMVPSWFTLKARLPPRTPPPLRNLRGPWKEMRYVCLLVGSGLILSNWLSPYYDAAIYSIGNGAPGNINDYAIAMLQAGSFVGRAGAGILADKFGVWNMYIASALLSTISLFAFWTGTSLPAPVVVIGLISYGISSGAWITLVAACCGAISPVREYGMRLGMLWSVGSIGTLVGPVICGLLITAKNQEFGYAAIFCALTTLIGVSIAVAPMLVKRIRVRVSKTQTESVEIKG